MVADRARPGLFARSMTWLQNVGEAMEETEVSLLSRRVAKLEKDFALLHSASADPKGRGGGADT